MTHAGTYEADASKGKDHATGRARSEQLDGTMWGAGMGGEGSRKGQRGTGRGRGWLRCWAEGGGRARV